MKKIIIGSILILFASFSAELKIKGYSNFIPATNYKIR